MRMRLVHVHVVVQHVLATRCSWWLRLVHVVAGPVSASGVLCACRVCNQLTAVLSVNCV